VPPTSYRLKQAEQLLRALAYCEVQTPDGPKWEKAENGARRERGEGGPEGCVR
jgi:hypothetical protein